MDRRRFRTGSSPAATRGHRESRRDRGRRLCGVALTLIVLGATSVGPPPALGSSQQGRSGDRKTTPGSARHRVLLVSIDGLGADILRRRDELGLEIPQLRELMGSGTLGLPMITVLPSATFPAHVSMVTGVRPNEHGVLANSRFVPEPAEDHPYGFASEVEVPTLFERVHDAGLRGAAVWWPVTAGGPAQFNFPDISGTSDTTTARHLFHLLRGPTGEVIRRPEDLIEITDDERTEVAVRFLRQRPDFAAVHLTALDAARHGAANAWDDDARRALEDTDARIGRLLGALQAAGIRDSTVVIITSDHGLTPIDRAVFPNALFRVLGLIDFDERGGVEAWRAMAYSAVGSAGIYLAADATAHDTAAVDRALAFLQRHPEHGIRRLLRGDEVEVSGGFRGAYAILTAEPNFAIVGVGVTGDIDRTLLLRDPRPQGQHGHDPELAALHAVLIAAGPGVRAGARIGEVSVLDIAPTIARMLGVSSGGMRGRVLEELFHR